MGITTTEIIKKEILQMMREMPLEQIKVKKLCDRLNIGRSTFYVYFDSIYDAVEEIEDELMSQKLFVNKLNGISEFSSLQEEVHASLQFLQDQIEVFEPLLGRYGDESFKYKWAKGITRRFHQLLISDNKSDEWNENVIAFVVGGVQKMITNWLIHQDSISMEAVEESFLDLVNNLQYLAEKK